jgi:probable rRNA maturation factor
VVAVDVENRSGRDVPADEAVVVIRATLAAEGIDDGELGLHFVGPDESRALKREHLDIDEATDVLSFPLDGRDPIAQGLPRQLGDLIVCPDVVGDDWRGPLVHGVLHLLGYDHGKEMTTREQELAS